MNLVIKRKDSSIIDKCYGILANLSNNDNYIPFFMTQNIISQIFNDVMNLEGLNEDGEHRIIIIIMLLGNLCSGPEKEHTEVI